MTKSVAQTPVSAMPVLPTALTSPRLYLSSTRAGWEGLVMQAFHEPSEVEGWSVPTASELSLVLFTGGAMHLERREAQGSWRGGAIYHGELVLNWGGSPAYEVRWRSLSLIPTQTLHLHVSQEVVAQVAEEVAGVHLARLELSLHSGFRDPLLTQVALTLRRELEQPTPAGKLYAQAAAQLLAVHLVRHYVASHAEVRTKPTPSRGLNPSQIKLVIEFIRAHLSESLSLDSLAQQVGFSPYYFARLFRQAAGDSPYQVVLRLRIERAQALLRETDLSLAQVAQACGFADQSHLSQVFKQQLGLTPHLYRQDHSTRATF